MSTVEDPAAHHPYTITAPRPYELRGSAPDALKAFALIHQAGIVPLNFHFCVVASRGGGAAVIAFIFGNFANPILKVESSMQDKAGRNDIGAKFIKRNSRLSKWGLQNSR